MSHSTAAVKFGDGSIMHGEFNGTVDVLLPSLYLTEEERKDNWRSYPTKWKRCDNKEHQQEEVDVAVSYGNGWYWKATACRECMCVIEPLSLETMGEGTDFPFPKDGLPNWYPHRELYSDYKTLQ